MALTTGGFTTYDANANREDLSDEIYNIDPYDVPILSSAGRTKAMNVTHEWQTDVNAAPDKTNGVLEGDDVTVSASTAPSRQTNTSQISRKEVAVSGSQQASNHAGLDDMLAYQKAKKGTELKTDIESVIVTEQGRNAGADVTIRRTRAIESWLATNVSRGATGANAANENSAPTDGTQRAVSEAILKEVQKLCWDNGAKGANVLYCGSFVKQAISGFTGRTSSRQNVGAQTIQGAAQVYAGDFGEIMVVPSRHVRSRSALLLDKKHIKVAYLRPIGYEELAKIGDSERGYMLAEYALEMCNEQAHGILADLNDS